MRTSGLQWNREKKKTHTHTHKNKQKKNITPDLGKYAQNSFW